MWWVQLVWPQEGQGVVDFISGPPPPLTKLWSQLVHLLVLQRSFKHSQEGHCPSTFSTWGLLTTGAFSFSLFSSLSSQTHHQSAHLNWLLWPHWGQASSSLIYSVGKTLASEGKVLSNSLKDSTSNAQSHWQSRCLNYRLASDGPLEPPCWHNHRHKQNRRRCLRDELDGLK